MTRLQEIVAVARETCGCRGCQPPMMAVMADEDTGTACTTVEGYQATQCVAVALIGHLIQYPQLGEEESAEGPGG